MTLLRGNDGLVGRFKKPGHLRTFQDTQAWRPRPEEAAMSGFGADRLFIEVFSVINCHVAPWFCWTWPRQVGRCAAQVLW